MEEKLCINAVIEISRLASNIMHLINTGDSKNNIAESLDNINRLSSIEMQRLAAKPEIQGYSEHLASSE